MADAWVMGIRVRWVVEFSDGGAWAVAVRLVLAGPMATADRPISGPWWLVSWAIRQID